MLVRKHSGDHWLLVFSEGLGNEDEVPCPRGTTGYSLSPIAQRYDRLKVQRPKPNLPKVYI